MVREGDIREVDGKKVVVTWSDGRNYSYKPYKEKVEKNEKVEENKVAEGKDEEKVESEPEAKRGKRKKV
jgi:hypothetical protein